jgi:hypothetical protein
MNGITYGEFNTVFKDDTAIFYAQQTIYDGRFFMLENNPILHIVTLKIKSELPL